MGEATHGRLEVIGRTRLDVRHHARSDAVLEGKLRAVVHEWREVLGRQVTQARQVLMKLLVDQFTIVPEERGGIRAFACARLAH